MLIAKNLGETPVRTRNNILKINAELNENFSVSLLTTRKVPHINPRGEYRSIEKVNPFPHPDGKCSSLNLQDPVSESAAP